MTDSPLRLRVVNVGLHAADEVKRRLATVADELVVEPETGAAEEARPEAPDDDLVVIEAGTDAATAFRLILEIRRTAPTAPIAIAVDLPSAADREAVDAIGEGLFLLGRSVTDAASTALVNELLARIRGAGDRWQGDLDAAHRELADLTAACSPAPLTASSRMLGGRPLQEAAPERFKRLIGTYRTLMDEALALRIRGLDQLDREELQALADRLGTLNAGPRDVIDLHRLTIADIVRNQPPQKARAYINEGRLVLIQLMGYLASFYRSLTWGGRRAAQPRSRPWASSS